MNMKSKIMILTVVFLLFMTYIAYADGLVAHNFEEEFDKVTPLQAIENATLEWNRTCGTIYDETGYKILVNESGSSSNIFVTGVRTIDWKFLVFNINSSGQIEWNDDLSASGMIKIFDMAVGQDGYIYLAGAIQQNRLIILKIAGDIADDSAIEVVFNKTLSYGNKSTILLMSGGFAISGDSFYIACTSSGLINTGSLSDVYIAKISLNGSILWNTTWGGNSSDEAVSLTIGPDGNLYVAGYSKSFTSTSSVFLLSFYPNGTLAFNMTWDSDSEDFAYDLFVDQYSYAYIVGQTGDDVLLLKTYRGEVFFNQSWDYDGEEVGYGIYVKGAHIYVTGYTSGNNTLKEDIIILRYDLSGNLLFSQIWAGEDTDIGYDIYVTERDEIYICGVTTSFGEGGKDIIVLKYSIPVLFGGLTTVESNVYFMGISLIVLLFVGVPIAIIVVIRIKTLK